LLIRRWLFLLGFWLMHSLSKKTHISLNTNRQNVTVASVCCAAVIWGKMSTEMWLDHQGREKNHNILTFCLNSTSPHLEMLTVPWNRSLTQGPLIHWIPVLVPTYPLTLQYFMKQKYASGISSTVDHISVVDRCKLWLFLCFVVRYLKPHFQFMWLLSSPCSHCNPCSYAYHSYFIHS